jgi:hypothetical protein
LNQGVDIIFQKHRPLTEISTFRDGQQPKLREMILVKFWFWSFWFFWTQRDCVAGRFGAMGFPQNQRRALTGGRRGSGEFSLCFLR